jgi:dihydroflavonol-4-reductase
VNVLVTGSTGFIGARLCRALVESGHRVRAFHRPSSTLRLLDGLDVEHALGDLSLPETVQAAMQGIEAVFHAAAWMGGSEPGRLYAVTVEGTRTVMQAALKAGVKRLVHTSSVAALGVPGLHSPTLLNEYHTWNYRPEYYPYGYAKYLAELEVQKGVAQGLDAVIVNPSLVFGPGDIYRQSKSIVNLVASRRLSVAVEGGINAVHLADVVGGHLAALERGRTGERYILGGENLTHLELLQRIAQVVGAPPPSMTLPARLLRSLSGPAGLLQSFLDLPVSADILHLAGYFFYYDMRKAQVELGLPEPRPITDAIREAFLWFSPSGKPVSVHQDTIPLSGPPPEETEPKNK